MEKSKRLLALLLSVMLIMGAVCSVPFTASAKEAEIAEVGAYSLRFDTFKINGQHMQTDKDYYCMFNPDAKESEPLYAVLDTEEAGYYVLYARNSQLTTGDNKVTIGIVDEKETLDHSMSLANNEESELSVRLEAKTRYFVKLCYNYEQDNYGSLDLRLSYAADAEPDEKTNTIIIKAGEAYEGSVDVAEDKDWIFVQVANDKKHSFTLENLNEEATAFKAEVYDTKNNLLDTVTTETENEVTVEFEKPSEVVSYYVCVTGANADVRGNYSIKMEEVAPKYVEIPLEEDYYDTITGFGTEGGHDYLKFTTIDKDAYYTVYAKNIDINTHSWSKENGLQFVIFNANSEEVDRIRLIPASEGSVTLKLKPDTTYFMQVYNHYLPDANGGNYKINISYVLDPDKNEMENATDWTLEEKYYGNIAARGDNDWFKITTNEDTDYTFTLKNISIKTHSWSHDLRFRGVIYNDKHEELAKLSMFSGEEFSTRITLDPNTTYYIEIFDPEGTTGDYSFDLSKTVIIDEDAVGMANAVELKYNEEYYDSITDWDGDNKVDYLKFTTLNEPAYYTLTAKNINIPADSWTGDNQVQVKIWNQHKEEISKLTLREGDEAGTTVSLDPNTTYYVRINHNQNAGGNYKVKVTYVLDPEANSMEQGKTLRIGERYYGTIATSGDKDYFKITTGEKTDLTLLLKNINIPTHSWSGDHQFRVVLYNKYSEELGVILATNGTEGNIKVTLEPDTTYYMGVWDPDNTTGDYNVILAESVLMGDVDLDEAVKIKDATLIQKALAKLAELDDKQNALADVTEDGKVNIKDATAIQKFLAKIDTGLRVGQLILNEIKYEEPATEATEPSSVVLTEPVTTTAVADETEPTEAVPTTVAIEPTAATDPTEAPDATDSTAIVDESTPAVETDPIPTETEVIATLTQLDTLKALNEEARVLLNDYKDYEKENPLDKDSSEMQLKKQLGYEDVSGESYGISEHEKFFRINDRVTYFLMHGYQYVDDYSEYIARLTKAIEWFNYYVTEVHPEPVIGNRIIYFRNELSWLTPHIYYWDSVSHKAPHLWPGIDMIKQSDDLYCYEVPREYDRVVFCSPEDSKCVSVEINLDQYPDADGFRLIDDYDNGYKVEPIEEIFPRPVL